MAENKLTIALAGNPNVGKSTVFNGLTGLKQHTGNWTGKTVDTAKGRCFYNNKEYVLIDLPGTYSLLNGSAEEEIARDYIKSNAADCVVVVADATALERNLILLLQILQLTDRVILALNMMDEAARNKITIDQIKLSKLLGIPVVPIVARKRKQLYSLLLAVETVKHKDAVTDMENDTLKLCSWDYSDDNDQMTQTIRHAEYIAAQTVVFGNGATRLRNKRIDKILTSKALGIPIMLLFLGLIFYITLQLANYPSALLTKLFAFFEGKFNKGLTVLRTPWWIHRPLMDGVYKTLAWVVAVMLPPMAIFFPLFTFMEDLGYLPRIAFNLDRPFKCCGCCGKQSLSMCMGLGCNAAGVIGTRIITGERERLIAILTNNFVPCNGRFPTLLTVSAIFIGGNFANSYLSGLMSALTLTLIIMLGITATLMVSFFLNKTFLRGKPSSFSLELPPFRKPQIGKILVRSLFDRTLKVLIRAVIIAAPAGLLIWLLANISLNGHVLLYYIASFLNPLARLMGMDGYILTAFLLGFPANEIVIPIVIMSYNSAGMLVAYESMSSAGAALAAGGWTWVTGISVLIFCLFHFPCATTCLTIKKETKSIKWTIIAILLPMIIGILLCISFASVVRLFT